jgi:transposase
MYLAKSTKSEVAMITKEDFAVIKALHKRGVYQKDIAAELGLHPRTVRRALKRAGAPEKKRQKRGSKLDPYKPKIDELLAAGVWNAMVIWRELQALGYEGEVTILRDYIRPKRKLRSGKATVRFETEPGRQLQHDWANIVTMLGGQEVKVHFQVNTLGYARRFHVWACPCEDAEHTYEGLSRSFTYFGGVTAEVLVDNQKATVLTPGSPRRNPQFNPRFLDMAAHYDFTARACRPYRARTKGKTERMVEYVKNNFFVRYREFESWAHLNQLLEHWLAAEADQRLHGTVKEVVAERFEREKPALRPWPQVPFDTGYWETRRVSWDAYVEVRGNRYSVPAQLAGQAVRIRLSLDGDLRIFAEDQLVVRHRLQPAHQGWVTVPEHHAELWRTSLQVERRTLEEYEEAASWN